MTDQPQRRLRADAEANLDRVLEAAADIFAEHGTHVSIELVAQRAGVGLGTIYRRFANKGALVAELVERLMQDVVDSAERHLADPGGTGLFAYLVEVGEMLASNRGSVSRIWSDPQIQTLVERSRVAQGELLAAAQKAGLVRPDLTREDVAMALWSIHGVLDITRGLPVAAWRRHIEILVAGWANHSAELRQPPLTPAEMTTVITHSPSSRHVAAPDTGPSASPGRPPRTSSRSG